MKAESKIFALSFVWLIAVSVFFMWLGVRMPVDGGRIVAFEEISFDSARDMVMSMALKCMADLSMFLLISLTSRPLINVFVASAMMAFRGIALGISSAYCAENAVGAASVVMIISFAMISALLLIYTLIINRVKSGVAVRVGLYLIATGAAVMLRLLPMMLI